MKDARNISRKITWYFLAMVHVNISRKFFLDRSREYYRENTPNSVRKYSTMKGACIFSRKNYVVFPRDGSREYQSEIFLDRSREYQRENTPYSLRDYNTVKGACNFLLKNYVVFHRDGSHEYQLKIFLHTSPEY